MRTTRRGDGGAALVELALILPVLALMVFGTIDLARAYRLNIRLEAAAREGAGFLQIYPNRVNCNSADDLADRVANEDPDLSSHAGYAVRAQVSSAGGPFSDYDVCEQAPESDTPAVDAGDRVRVEVDGDFDVLTPLLGVIIGDQIEITGTAEVVAQGSP